MAAGVRVLGGYQTDFRRNLGREGKGLFELMQEAVAGTLAATDLAPDDIEVAHVGNFVAELFCQQGHLGGMFAAIDPAFSGLPAARHEAACASGSIALLAAQADILAGHYDVACVLGVELMRHTDAKTAADNLATAAWIGREGQEARWMWPWMFARLGDEYERRYGLEREHLAAIARNNFANARRNPNAQTREWILTDESFGTDEAANPVIEGRIRKSDCGQITDGAACVVVASERFAARYAERRGVAFDRIPRVAGWGHRTATLRLEDKFRESPNDPYILPHVRGAIADAYRRAAIAGPDALDVIETHDCFTTTEYLAIDHFGMTEPGESWKAIESGRIALGGDLPINPSGGLIGAGHPVGATGVRMLLDAWKQLSGTAGGYQVEGARRAATLNIGGSGTTTVSFILERDA
ncbi:MAG: thiolase domain-containing protein [Alphaproteobacteria bacterium]|nr:thiolase domain-containing protein [Alphaproteobacteria bacterium]